MMVFTWLSTQHFTPLLFSSSFPNGEAHPVPPAHPQYGHYGSALKVATKSYDFHTPLLFSPLWTNPFHFLGLSLPTLEDFSISICRKRSHRISWILIIRPGIQELLEKAIRALMCLSWLNWIKHLLVDYPAQTRKEKTLPVNSLERVVNFRL